MFALATSNIVAHECARKTDEHEDAPNCPFSGSLGAMVTTWRATLDRRMWLESKGLVDNFGPFSNDRYSGNTQNLSISYKPGPAGSPDPLWRPPHVRRPTTLRRTGPSTRVTHFPGDGPGREPTNRPHNNPDSRRRVFWTETLLTSAGVAGRRRERDARGLFVTATRKRSIHMRPEGQAISDCKLLGRNYTTPDLVAKVTGRAKYAEDFRICCERSR